MLRPLVLVVLALTAAGPRAQEPATATPEVPARAGRTTLSWGELDELLVRRHALSDAGRFALEHLVERALLDHLADEAGLVVEPAEIAARWREIDEQARANGLEGGVLDQLRATGIEPDEFREVLRLSLVHERLTRAALGLPEDAPVTGDQQKLWIEQEMRERGLETPAPPWPDGVAARCGEVEVPAATYAVFLRKALPPEDVRRACREELLEKALRARMPDVSAEAIADAIEAEVELRRADAADDPRYAGVDFDALLRAQGMVPRFFPEDPAVVAAALTRLWVDRNQGEEGLRRVFEEERAHFENLYGEAVETYVLFLGAAQRTNQLQSRDFEAARAELGRLAGSIETLDDFRVLAEQRSEDRRTREAGGRVGWVTRGAPDVPASLRDAVFLPLETGTDLTGDGLMVGPVDLENGVALLWLAARRPSPPWEEMREHVHRELRGRLASEVLPRASVETFLDVE